jgi:hypothetical protein
MLLFGGAGVLMLSWTCKTRFEKAWLVASTTALLLHHLLEAEPDPGGIWLLETAMIVLTFPFGPIAMLFIAIGVEQLRVYADMSWLLDWSTLLFAGYIQWFWVLPEIRRNNQLIALNLAAPVETVSPVEHAPPVEIISPAKVTTPFEVASPAQPSPDNPVVLPKPARAVFNTADFVPAFAGFDEAGLTALDRVLRAEKFLTPAQTPVSHA